MYAKRKKRTVSCSSNEENSPEFFVAVKDQYSSDDEKTDPGASSSKKRKPEKPVKLPKHTQSSDMTGVEILFFFDLDYSRSPSHPLDLTNSLAEHILGSIFKFIFPCDHVDDNNDDNSTFVFRGVTMLDMLKKAISQKPAFKWMKENDHLNYKTCSYDAIVEKLKYIRHFRLTEKIVDPMKRMIHEFLEVLMVEYSQNGLNKHDHARSIFRILSALMQNNIIMKYYGEAKYFHQYWVSENIASDECPSKTSLVFEGERQCLIAVCPDAVYLESDVPVLAVEVFAPESGSPTSASEDEVISAKSGDKVYSKPERKKDAILNKEYQKEATKFLKQFLFHDSSDSATLNKILGQHIVQLITLAESQQKLLQKTEQQVFGIFMKNEYLFFSKLVTNAGKINSYKAPSFPPELSHIYTRLSEIGKVTFANWRIDLTIPAHRMAVVTFLAECLFLQ